MIHRDWFRIMTMQVITAVVVVAKWVIIILVVAVVVVLLLWEAGAWSIFTCPSGIERVSFGANTLCPIDKFWGFVSCRTLISFIIIIIIIIISTWPWIKHRVAYKWYQCVIMVVELLRRHHHHRCCCCHSSRNNRIVVIVAVVALACIIYSFHTRTLEVNSRFSCLIRYWVRCWQRVSQSRCSTPCPYRAYCGQMSKWSNRFGWSNNSSNNSSNNRKSKATFKSISWIHERRRRVDKCTRFVALFRR